jgi:hypothetical protein
MGVSAATGEGMQALMYATFALVKRTRAAAAGPVDPTAAAGSIETQAS